MSYCDQCAKLLRENGQLKVLLGRARDANVIAEFDPSRSIEVRAHYGAIVEDIKALLSPEGSTK